jgi:hypothetical protein
MGQDFPRGVLVNHVIASIDIKRIASDEPRRIVGEKSGGQPHVHDANKAPRWRLLLGFVEEFVEFRDAGGGARRQRAR